MDDSLKICHQEIGQVKTKETFHKRLSFTKLGAWKASNKTKCGQNSTYGRRLPLTLFSKKMVLPFGPKKFFGIFLGYQLESGNLNSQP